MDALSAPGPVAALIIAARVLPVVLWVPWLGGAPLAGGLAPVVARVGLGLALVAWLVPAVPADLDPSAPELVALLARELAAGALLALVASLPYFAALTAGLVVEPAAGLPARALPFAAVLATTVLVAADGHLFVVRALAATYQVLPVTGRGVPSAVLAAGPAAALATSGRLFTSALSIAAPFLLARLVVEVLLAAAARVAGGLAGSAAVVRPLVWTAVWLVVLGGVAALLRADLGSVMEAVPR